MQSEMDLLVIDGLRAQIAKLEAIIRMYAAMEGATNTKEDV